MSLIKPPNKVKLNPCNRVKDQNLKMKIYLGTTLMTIADEQRRLAGHCSVACLTVEKTKIVVVA